MSLVSERYGLNPAPDRSRRRRALLTAAALGLFFAAHANWRTPVLRFATPAANSVAFAATLALPWAALALAQPVLRGWRRVAHFAALAPLLLYTLPLGTCAAMDAADTLSRGVDYSFEPRGALALGPSRVRVYRTDCGATCDFGVVIRHERPVLPGVLLVREMESWSHAGAADLAASPGGVRAIITETSRGYRGPGGPHVLAVHPWVYF